MTFSKAKPKQDGTKQVDIAIPAFGYKSHISVDRRHKIIPGRRSPMQRLPTVHACAKGGSIRKTLLATYGATVPTPISRGNDVPDRWQPKSR